MKSLYTILSPICTSKSGACEVFTQYFHLYVLARVVHVKSLYTILHLYVLARVVHVKSLYTILSPICTSKSGACEKSLHNTFTYMY